MGTIWVGAWLFTIGYADLSFWRCVLAIVACVWVTLAAFWGVDTPASAGHFSVNSAIGMGAEGPAGAAGA